LEQKDHRQGDAKNVVEQNPVAGKNNVVIGAGRDVKDIHIGHVGDNYAPQLPRVAYSTEKTWAPPIPIHIPSIRKGAIWTCWISGLAFVADVLSVLGFFGVSGASLRQSPLWHVCFYIAFWLFIVSLLIYVISDPLRNGVFRHFFGNWGLRGDESKRLTLEKLRATCPICGGRILLHRRYNLPPIGECEKCSQHIFAFDPTTMSGDPMVTTYFYANR